MTKLTQQNYVVNGKSYFYVCPFLMLEIIIGSDTFVDCGYIRLMSHVWQHPAPSSHPVLASVPSSFTLSQPSQPPPS